MEEIFFNILSMDEKLFHMLTLLVCSLVVVFVGFWQLLRLSKLHAEHPPEPLTNKQFMRNTYIAIAIFFLFMLFVIAIPPWDRPGNTEPTAFSFPIF